MAAGMESPLTMAQAGLIIANFKEDDRQLTILSATRHKTTTPRVVWSKFATVNDAPVQDCIFWQQRGTDATVTRYEVAVGQAQKGASAYWSEATIVNTTQRDIEPPVNQEVLSLVTIPQDSLSCDPSQTGNFGKTGTTATLPIWKVVSSWDDKPCPIHQRVDGKDPRDMISHPVVLDEKKSDDFHDPMAQAPWLPWESFDERVQLAHAQHLLEWQAISSRLNLDEARRERHVLHNEKCQHKDCGCDDVAGIPKSDLLSKAEEHLDRTKQMTPQFYKHLQDTHLIPGADEPKQPKTKRKKGKVLHDENIDLLGLYRMYDSPDGPIGVFSQPEVDLFFDQARLKARTAHLASGATEEEEDELELRTLHKTQSEFLTRRAQIEDVLFKQHRIFPKGRKHELSQAAVDKLKAARTMLEMQSGVKPAATPAPKAAKSKKGGSQRKSSATPVASTRASRASRRGEVKQTEVAEASLTEIGEASRASHRGGVKQTEAAEGPLTEVGASRWGEVKSAEAAEGARVEIENKRSHKEMAKDDESSNSLPAQSQTPKKRVKLILCGPRELSQVGEKELQTT